MAADVLISLKNITKIYEGDIAVLDNVSFDVKIGEALSYYG